MKRQLFAMALVMGVGATAFAEEAPGDVDPADALLVQAQDTTAPVTTAKSDADPYTSTSWIFFLGTGLIALGGWGITQWRKRQVGVDGDAIEHINSLAIGPKHRVSVIEVDGKRLLIGLSDGHITLLSDLGAANPQTEESGDWREVLEATRSRVFSDAPAPEPRPPVTERSGTFERFEGRTPGVQPRKNRETDSVMIGLKALESKARR